MSKGLTSRIVATILILGVPAIALAAEDFRDEEYLRERIPGRLETQRIGEPVVWSNPSTGNSGVVVIDREDTAGGMLCREYRRITNVRGADPIIYAGRGCRDNTGRWLVQPEVAAAPPVVPGRGSDPAPVASTDPVLTEPPSHLPPAHKPDPAVFYANIPTPSVY